MPSSDTTRTARIAFLNVRVPAAEKDLYSHLAAEANLNLTEFIRQACRWHAAEICGGIGARNRLMLKVQAEKELRAETGARQDQNPAT